MPKLRLSLGGKFLLAVCPFVLIGSIGTTVYYRVLHTGERAFMDALASEGTLDDAAREAASYAVRLATETFSFLIEPSDTQRSRIGTALADYEHAKSDFDRLRVQGTRHKDEIRLASVLDRFASLIRSVVDRHQKMEPLVDRAEDLEARCRAKLLAVIGGGALGLAQVNEFANQALTVLRASPRASDAMTRWRDALARVRIDVGSSPSPAMTETRKLVDELEAAVAAYRAEVEPMAGELDELLQMRSELDDMLYGGARDGATAPSSRQQAVRVARQGMTAIWIVAILQGTLGIAAILYFGRNARSRIQAIGSAIVAISNGDLATRIPESGTDELTDLARQFNQMASQLERTTVSRAELEDREAALTVSEQRLRLLVEQLKDCAIFMVSPFATITSWNAGAERLYGYRERDAVGQPLQMLYDDASGAQTVIHDLEQAAAGGGYAFEGEQRRRDGSHFWAEISMTPLDGASAHVVLVRDVTDQRAAEQERQQHLDQLAHVGRLSVMGEMAAGLAHELNQPLGAISNYAEGSLLRLVDGRVTPDMLREILERIAVEAQRAGEIIHRVRVFARKEERHSQEVDLAAAIERVVALLSHDAVKQGVDLLVDLGQDLPRVTGDRVQVEQVLVNLIRNAFDAVRSSANDGNPREVTVRAEVNDEGDAHVTVLDTGCGIPEGFEVKVFDAFYTTKADGLGMGLAISRTIVEAHGGRIWVSRNLQRGLTAHVTLPRRGLGQFGGAPGATGATT